MVMVVMMLFFSPLSVFAASWASWTVAALLVTAVPPLSGQWQRWDFALQVCLLQDGRCAQLRRFTDGLRGFVVPRGGDLPDLAAAAQA